MPSIFVNASNTIGFTQGEDPEGVFELESGGSFDVVDSALSNFKLESSSGTVTFSDEVAQNLKAETISDVLAFGDSVSSPLLGQNLTHNLSFSDSLASSALVGDGGDTLSLSDSFILQAPIKKDLSHDLSLGNIEDANPDDVPAADDPLFAEKMEALLADKRLRDEAEYGFNVKVGIFTDYLSLSQHSAPITHILATNHHIHLLDVAREVEFETLTSYLDFEQAAVGTNTKGTSSSLSFSDLVDHDIDVIQSVTSNITLSDVVFARTSNRFPPGHPLAATGANQVRDARQEYDADGSIPKLCPLPLVSPSTHSVTFSYPPPPTTPDEIFTIRPPALQNQETFNFRRIRRRTRGGEMQIFRRKDTVEWPKWVRLRMTYPVLNDSERHTVLSFFKLTLGLNIGFLDWEGRQWVGIITTPQAAFEEIGKGIGCEGCQHEITFEFQGVCQ